MERDAANRSADRASSGCIWAESERNHLYLIQLEGEAL
jgi:hypothetical protein